MLTRAPEGPRGVNWWLGLQGAGRRLPAALPAGAILLVLLAQGAVYSVHSGLVLSRADTRTMTREWMVANVPRGAKIVVEPVVPDDWAPERRAPRRGRPGSSYRWCKWPSLYSFITRTGAIDRAGRHEVSHRGLRADALAALIPYYERARLLLGRDRRDPGRARGRRPGRGAAARSPTTAPSQRQGTVVYRSTPYSRGARPVSFNFDWSFDYYPLAYSHPGPLMTIYRLHGGRCSGLTAATRDGGTAGLSSECDGDDAPTPTGCTSSGRSSSPAAASGSVKPNPIVGAVIAGDGHVLGEGWHEYYGGAHAEVNAIGACGDADLDGATLYVSLEPCCHNGKTPPCTDAIVAAGIRRVVIASDDPTEKASGPGLGILRDEGVEVLVADGEVAARGAAGQPAVPQARADRPPVGAVQVGDDARRQGRDAQRRLEVDLRRGEPRARAPLARVGRRGRRRDRHGAGRRPAADRARRAASRRAGAAAAAVVFDSLARLPLASQLVGARERGAADRRRLARRRRAPTPTRSRRPGSQVLVASGENEPARVRGGARPARRGGISSILLEGGPHLAGAFLDAGEIDEVRLFLAPMLLGGSARAGPARGRRRRADRRGDAGADARAARASARTC